MPMCWISRNTPKRSRAIRNIPVYKILTYDPVTDKYISPVMGYVHKFGKEEESILDLPGSNTLSKNIHHDFITVYHIDKGFHSYQKSSLRKQQKTTHTIICTGSPNTSWCIIKYWPFEHMKKRHMKKRTVLCSAHIPKGASYYLNEWGEYVSDTLVINKVLDANKELKTLDINKRIRTRILKRSK